MPYASQAPPGFLRLAGKVKNMDERTDALKPNAINERIYGVTQPDADLIESIRQHGILEPLIIKADRTIVSGHRRWQAALSLGLRLVPVHEVAFASELDERAAVIAYNRQREKTFVQKMKESDELKDIESEKARQRQAHGRTALGRTLEEIFPEREKGQARDKVAEQLGMSGRTLDKAVKVWSAAKDGDELAQKLVKNIDAGKETISGAHKKIRIQERLDSVKKIAEQSRTDADEKTKSWIVTADQQVIKCDALITDPPYGILTETWEPGAEGIEDVTRLWATRWSKCEADFIISFFSQRFMWEGKKWFDESLYGYEFQQLLVWHYPNNKKPQSRMGFKQTWEPIFFYRRINSQKKISLDTRNWGGGLHDFDCHVAAVPQSNFNDADAKVHPAQKPVSVMRWLIAATTTPGELVVDPFMGSGTTGIAASQLGRRFHGIEIDSGMIKIAQERIACYG